MTSCPIYLVTDFKTYPIVSLRLTIRRRLNAINHGCTDIASTTNRM